MYDVPYTIKYEGFKSDDRLDNYLKFWLYSVLDYCPYDSFIDLQVSALTNRFLVEIKVYYTSESFHGLGEDITIEGAVEAAEKSLYSQIKTWRSIRFTDVMPAKNKMEVLVVDDDPISTKVIETCLNEQGCAVHRVSSGEEAIYSFKNKHYNFVVMDWNMQPLNGRETLKVMDSNMNINKGVQRSKIPVLTYSINNQDKISFPRVENLYQFAYLSKTSSFKNTFETTKKIVEHLNQSDQNTLDFN